MRWLFDNKGLEFVFNTVTNRLWDRQENVKICIIAVKISDRVYVVAGCHWYLWSSDADALMNGAMSALIWDAMWPRGPGLLSPWADHHCRMSQPPSRVALDHHPDQDQHCHQIIPTRLADSSSFLQLPVHCYARIMRTVAGLIYGCQFLFKCFYLSAYISESNMEEKNNVSFFLFCRKETEMLPSGKWINGPIYRERRYCLSFLVMWISLWSQIPGVYVIVVIRKYLFSDNMFIFLA